MRCSVVGCSAAGQRCARCWTPAAAHGEGGRVGYGLGIEHYALPGGVELVGHLGGTAGYTSFVGCVRPLGLTMTLDLNVNDDPTSLVIPAVQALAATHR
jgi:hypothetical protein